MAKCRTASTDLPPDHARCHRASRTRCTDLWPRVHPQIVYIYNRRKSTAGQRPDERTVRMADDIAARLAPDDPQSTRVAVLGIFAAAIGTLQLSRALTDPVLADAILEQGIQNALAALAAEQRKHRAQRKRR